MGDPLVVMVMLCVWFAVNVAVLALVMEGAPSSGTTGGELPSCTFSTTEADELS